jgi:hypothetical protein
MLAREDVEVNLHAVETMTEQFQLCEWGTVVMENYVVVGSNAWIMGCT